MIEASLRKTYQKICVDPLLKHTVLGKLSPWAFTICSFLTGVVVLPLLAFHHSLWALACMGISGYCDTMDGSVARLQQRTSPQGASLDILADRTVESSIMMGLFCFDPTSRALPILLMFSNVLLCVTSFLVVGIFKNNESEKSFHYSPGLVERAEAFIFFASMIVFPNIFSVLAYLFSFLVFMTTLLRIREFFKLKEARKNSWL